MRGLTVFIKKMNFFLGMMGPVGPAFPPVSIAAPPPPPEAETDAEPQLPVSAGIHPAQEVRVIPF
jgi:hypothetical protein